MRSPTSSRLLPCIAGLASIFVFALSASTVPAALIRASAELHLDPTLLARTLSFQYTAFFVTTLVGGVLADFFGKKVLFVIAAALTALGAAMWGLAGSLAAACLAAAIMGMGGGVLEGLSSALLSDLYPERRKLLLNLSQVFYCLAAIGGPALIGWLMPRGVSWRLFFGAVALSGLALLLLYAISHIPRPPPHQRIDGTRLREILSRKRVLVPCVVIFCYVLSESCVAMYANYYLNKILHAPEAWAIYAISGFWGMMGLGRLTCAMLPERISYERLVALLCAAGGGAMLLQHWQTHWLASLICFAANGLVFAGAWPLIVGLTANRNPHYSGTVIGILVSVGSLGCVAAPPMMNLLLERLPVSWVFPAAAAPLLVSIALVLWLARDPLPVALQTVPEAV